MNFGKINLNAAALQVFTLTNLTPNIVTFSGATFQGPDLQDFSQDNTMQRAASPSGQLHCDGIRFSPAVAAREARIGDHR